MEQSLEMMRKRHAYYTQLINGNNIRTAKAFYNHFSELFQMLGTDLHLYENCVGISITYELDSYEEYTITDGIDGGLAIVSPIVQYQYMFTNRAGNIFEIDHLEY
ncbi:hypothetical protein ED388_11950 [Muribaculaceae bacterium Isolate-007 (NCI)]|uniref:hypothetical protein n=1 Tax=Muribaculum intestinale TaxID=1796646 RepID=UPI000F47C90E|nr:hypothetical protein [Muribaculum intestinale]ROT04233.1 hypothetical protein EEL42_11320 [Muribaculaceae bacterium Isolate-100 (HZI)]RXE64257.1 hypothetical protein ED388_11950 [Muribaculaceae bacterium Isolate-007 (NCI)]TGX79426.1 hypothetical protein E5360_12375 [Muribaculum intestinale]